MNIFKQMTIKDWFIVAGAVLAAISAYFDLLSQHKMIVEAVAKLEKKVDDNQKSQVARDDRQDQETNRLYLDLKETLKDTRREIGLDIRDLRNDIMRSSPPQGAKQRFNGS